MPLIELLQENWHWSDTAFRIKGKNKLNIEMHTGGWSGNESIITALKQNDLFFLLYWYKEIRGGHYYFKIDIKDNSLRQKI